MLSRRARDVNKAVSATMERRGWSRSQRLANRTDKASWCGLVVDGVRCRDLSATRPVWDNRYLVN